MRVCVYCASSPKIDAAYFEATRRLAIAFVENGVEVVFGGGATGLMGQLADTVLEKGGKIKGIMPQFMNEVEWAHRGVSDFEFTKSMHERKARFLEGIDAVVALPGGTGTFEELLEAITLKRLGQFTKPIIIVNTNDYYAPLRQMLEKAVAQNFMHKKHLRMWTFVDEAEEVLPAIMHTGEWGEGALNIARNT
jgi:uncharacterized protein (TIGR00730 family)